MERKLNLFCFFRKIPQMLNEHVHKELYNYVEEHHRIASYIFVTDKNFTSIYI